MSRSDVALTLFALVVILFAVFQAVDVTMLNQEAESLSAEVSEVAEEREQLARQHKREKWVERPAVAAAAEEPEPAEPVFVPLEIDLAPDLQQHAWDMCQREEIPFSVFMALMWGESRHTPDVEDNVNNNGTYDRGICQINEINWEWLAAEYGLDINDPYDNIEAGAIILGMFWHRYTPEQALTAYTWGETGMLAHGVSSTAIRLLEKAEEYEV